jgi:UDPglucose 6-dehydrogenase
MHKPSSRTTPESGLHEGAALRISVIGCGYLGAVHAACLASLGHEVVGIDVDAERIGLLEGGTAPFHEPGFDHLLAETARSGRVGWTTDIAEAAGCSVHFLCVGTPQLDGSGGADLRFVHEAFDALRAHLSPGDLVVGKSTVPVGTAAELAERLHRGGSGAGLAWNPEFLREGCAVQDTLRPDRLVYGVADGDYRSAQVLDVVYADLLQAGVPRIVTNLETAELVKVASNAFLATKISFINAMAALCDASGADVLALSDAMGRDPRIGNGSLAPGLGFGGSCLGKDIRALHHRAQELGVGQELGLLRHVDRINEGRRELAGDLAREACGGDVDGRRVAVLGAAFKPGSDDVRDSPALAVAEMLHDEGALVTVTDPKALDNARKQSPQLHYAEDVDAAALDADVLLLLTDWPEYKALDPLGLTGIVRQRSVVDTRHSLDADAWRAAGWDYVAPGRPHA